MSLFTSNFLRERAFNEIQKSGLENKFSSQTRSQLVESRLFSSLSSQKNDSSLKKYDIFLSHSSKDAVEVKGMKLVLEDMGYTVYVDWIEDPNLDRSKVTKETAVMLQNRMRQSKSLVYAYSINGQQSKWMPWELGFFDGLKGMAVVLPIAEDGRVSDSYDGAEFLGIYNYVVRTQSVLWVHKSATQYVSYSRWLNGDRP